jgi:anti-sigma B factor antagonist
MSKLHSETTDLGVAVVTLEGEHELYGAEKLRERIGALIADGVSVVVDLTHAEFVDSSVVGVLLAAQKRAAGAGVTFTVVVGPATGEPVRRMFEVTGLSRILSLVEQDR